MPRVSASLFKFKIKCMLFLLILLLTNFSEAKFRTCLVPSETILVSGLEDIFLFQNELKE